MIYLIRRERFNAAHRLFREEWSDEQNQKVFGKCSNPNWHGHNYNLYVTIKGELNQETGFLFNLHTLSSVINKHVIEKVDHKNLNLEVDFMKGRITSTENLAIAIWEVLEPYIRESGCELHSVKLEETENNSVEYFGKK
jgi:6-pyruvoyltetrahydropterin/6-carboxytetrahydropterin synthase